jgi:transposase, IS30 family
MKLGSHSAPENCQALIEGLKNLPRKFRKTLTYDNGAENSWHRQVNQRLGTKSYFCDRQKSWQKGTVENTIGRIRRTIKRGADLRHLSLKALKRLERQMNNTPRKCLQFRTPMEAWRAESVALHS